MKSTLLLVAILAATIGAAAAQGHTAGANTGGSTRAANGNNSVSSGNSSNTSSSAPNSNPTTAAPNYKPASKPAGTGTSAKPAKKTPGTVVSSGGQGHNTTPDTKGKIKVAPSATTSGKSSPKK